SGTEKSNMKNSFFYFGYGSSLNLALIEFRINEPVISFEKGKLKNYALRFNRQNPDGTARANLIAAKGEYTLGIIYELPKTKFELLSQTEPFYNLIETDIETDNGVKKAFTFMCPKLAESLFPQESYLKVILEGAELHHFPIEYIELIKNLAQAKKQSHEK
ncbi:MAG: gamma-glutamylcyclotransferase, partial [Bacteroidetes bacterium]|nr:gamma-glutamylcyclotransferase [Bacteroidota bacterium]